MATGLAKPPSTMGSSTSPGERCYKSQYGDSGLQLKHVALQQTAISIPKGSQAHQSRRQKKQLSQREVVMRVL